MTTGLSGAEARISDKRWREALGPSARSLVSRVIAAAMSATGRSGAVDILFTDDEEMRRLNKQWRKLDKPTDVLSFPTDGPEIAGQPRHLGDIALGFETALRDAGEMGRPFEAHVSHLLVHGFLHLVGYDHVEPKDAAVMEPLEAEVLADLGWPDPYATGPYAREKGRV